MSKFDCFTQYDNIFDELTDKNNQRGKKNFCPFFSLITVANFFSKKNITKMANGDGKTNDNGYQNGNGIDMSKKVHEVCLAKAIASHVAYDYGDQLRFDDLIALTSLSKKDIMCTTTELVFAGAIGYDTIFPTDFNVPYAVIFLKNGKFFAVLHSNGKFHVRDCHEGTQHNDLSRDNVIKHLNGVYQFDHDINLDGYKIEEYSNIEFLHITGPFETKLDFNMGGGIIDKITDGP